MSEFRRKIFRASVTSFTGGLSFWCTAFEIFRLKRHLRATDEWDSGSYPNSWTKFNTLKGRTSSSHALFIWWLSWWYWLEMWKWCESDGIGWKLKTVEDIPTRNISLHPELKNPTILSAQNIECQSYWRQNRIIGHRIEKKGQNY